MRDTGRSGRPEIVVLSSVDWRYLWQRAQQLARKFADVGLRTVFVENTPASVVTPDLGQEGLRAALEQLVAMDARWDGSVRISRAFVEARTSADGQAKDVFELWLDALCSMYDLKNPVFWVMGWQVGKYARALRERGLLVYDCADDLSGFVWVTPELIHSEELLISEADVVFAVSRKLVGTISRRNPNVYLLPNGVDPEQFAVSIELRAQRPERRPVIGYVGALAEWVDISLLAQLAQQNPSFNFLIVGSAEGADLLPLRGLPNVVLPGRVPHNRLAEVLGKCDVGIVPFQLNRSLLDSADLIKIYEYVAAGLPVVSTPHGDYRQSTGLVLVASSVAEFSEAIAMALHAKGPEFVEARRQYAAANSWRLRVDGAVCIIEACLSSAPATAARILGEGREQVALSNAMAAELGVAAIRLLPTEEALAECLQDDSSAQTVLAHLMSRGDVKLACRLASALVERSPNNPDNVFNLATVRMSAGQYGPAIANLARLILAEPSAMLVNMVADALARLGRRAEAESWSALAPSLGNNEGPAGISRARELAQALLAQSPDTDGE